MLSPVHGFDAQIRVVRVCNGFVVLGGRCSNLHVTCAIALPICLLTICCEIMIIEGVRDNCRENIVCLVWGLVLMAQLVPARRDYNASHMRVAQWTWRNKCYDIDCCDLQTRRIDARTVPTMLKLCLQR